MPSKKKRQWPDPNLLTKTEIADRVFKNAVSREWVRRHCGFARVEMSPRRVFYRVNQVRAFYGK